MKLILSLVLAISIVVLGVLISNYYKRRNKFFCDVSNFCDVLLSEINFLQLKLLQIVNKHKTSYGVDFKNFLNLFSNYLNDGIDKEKFQNKLIKSQLFLSEVEAIDLFNFFVNLGGLDIQNETNNINNFKNLFNKYRDLSEINKQKFSPLSIKLSIVVGLVVVILFA